MFWWVEWGEAEFDFTGTAWEAVAGRSDKAAGQAGATGSGGPGPRENEQSRPWAQPPPSV